MNKVRDKTKMRQGTSKKKAMKFLSMLLAFVLLLSGNGMPVFANTVSQNEAGADNEAEADNDIEAEPETAQEEAEPEGELPDGDTDEMLPQTGGAQKLQVKEGEGKTPANPVHHCTQKNDNSDYTDWDYIYFGSYPQTEVKDAATIEAIENAIKTREEQLSSYNQTGIGTNVWVNNSKYSRISKSDMNDPNSNGIYFGDSEYRYFKWERIKWKVLQNDGNTLMVMADLALDCKKYDDQQKDVTWETCTLREWLNSSFYNTAFNFSEQSAIVEQNIMNEANPFNGTEGGNDTNDKIYQLSVGEARNETYGFCSNENTYSASRTIKTSDFANARGAARETMSDWKDNSFWWLRSPGADNVHALSVETVGYITKNGDWVITRNMGVSPVLHINVASDVWLTEDDGTSGEGGEERIFTGLQAAKTKTAYIQGEKLSLDDLTVTASYSYETGDVTRKLPEDVYTTNGSDLDMNTLGSKILTVSYTEQDVTKTADIAVTVNEKPVEVPEKEPDEETQQQPDEETQQPEKEIQKQPVKVTKLTIKAPSKKLAAGKKVQLTLTVAPKNADNKTVVWKTSNKKYATVNKKGKVTLKKAGIGKTVTITATANDGSGKRATIKIKIMKHAVKSVKLAAPKKTLKAGKTMKLKATVKTTGKNVNKTLKWTSSNTKYATVNKNGKVTAKKGGKGKTVTITATSTDGSNKKAKVKIKIK